MGAYVCHPFRGSEPTVGWNRAVEASRFGEVHVITHDEGNRDIVLETVRKRNLANLHFHFLDRTPLEIRLMSFPGGYYPGYRRWQHRAYLWAQEMHERQPFDVAHQVNLCGYREPGELWRLDVPFVWGPVGGTQNTPTSFFGYGGASMALREGLRGILNDVQIRTSRRVREAALAADVVLAANSTGKRDLEAALGIEVRQLLETGVRDIGTPKRWAHRTPGPFRLLWAGEVVQRKGIRIVLDAVRQIRKCGGPDIHLIVVGDGPARDEVSALEGVDYRGLIPRDELLSLYLEVDALAFTSLRDTSGNVMLEGLAAGLPVVYLDHQGAADMGSEACGIPVPVTTPEDAVEGVAKGVVALATDPSLYDRLSIGAIQRATHFHWRENGDAVNAVYSSLIDAPLSTSSGDRERSFGRHHVPSVLEAAPADATRH